MVDHTDQLVGTLFRILSEKGHTEAQQALLRTYESQATADRKDLTEELFSEFITVLHERIDTQLEVDILTTSVERLLNRFAAVVETAPVAILVVNDDGGIQVWNDGAERIFGWQDTEVRRRPYPRVLSEQPETIEEFLKRLRNGEKLHGIETQHTHKNGAVLDVRIWAAPIHTREDAFTGGVFVISDITEPKQREQRLAVLNRVLRHNIRNDINIIHGHLEMLAEEHPEENEHIRIMDDRLSNIVELSRTARNIEQLQDDEETDRTTIELGVLLRERLNRLRAESRDAHISSDLPDSLTVIAHELLPYAFDNILDNAIEHNDSETPRVAVRSTVDDSRSHVVVSIADNGPGIPQAEREVLTSRTETPLTHSSGLGLWLTRWIVRSSKGSITVHESELGGTCVSIRLRARSD
ncbi:PAS domain S-box-containing protein [Halopenitus persicus]|uniref:histidine kinase n=2 Tax=Halopenitus persicus TaxID=1048396 RepID=A0A1H3DZ02_9EURY|nr:PAS domain S-box-containing protein [Halopenitus persicus]